MVLSLDDFPWMIPPRTAIIPEPGAERTDGHGDQCTMSDHQPYEDDRELAAMVVAGSVPAWHRFVGMYSGLIQSVLRRYIFDEEQVKDVWVKVLEKLRQGQLERYEGRSKLGTWLVFVVRSAAVDHLRSRDGRRRHPPGFDDLPERDRFVYHEVCIARRDPDEVGHALKERGDLADGESLAGILARLEDTLGDHTLRRVAWDVEARSVGAVSGRVLEYLEHATAEARERQRALSPERELLHDQTRRTLARVQEARAALAPDERQALEMRFEKRMTAPQIAEAMDLQQREVYTLIERALRNVRRLLGLSVLLVVLVLGIFLR